MSNYFTTKKHPNQFQIIYSNKFKNLKDINKLIQKYK